jgi:phage tail sheath gpL-like
MKTRTILLTLLLGFVGAAVCFADDPQMGTWKLNEAKSKIGAGSPKLTKVVYEAAGDSVKVTVDGTDGDGNPLHSEWTGKYDGKDYTVIGDPSTDTRSYKKVNDHTLAFTNKKGDKVTISGHGVVSADGKTRTVTITGTDSKGKKFTSTTVYDKQ